MKHRLLLCLIAASATSSMSLAPQTSRAADEVSNVRINETGDKYLITYDLESQVPGFVDLLGSADGGRTFDLVMEFVVGDVGERVSPGKDLHILWDAKMDLAENLDDSDIVVYPSFSFRKQAYQEARQFQAVKTKAEYQEDLRRERENYTRWVLDNEARLKELMRKKRQKSERLSSLRMQTPLLVRTALKDERARKKAEKAEKKRAKEIEDLTEDVDALEKDIDSLQTKIRQLKAERRELD